MFDQFKQQLPDIDPQETWEWVEALDRIVERKGEERARFLFYRLMKRARMLGVGLPPTTTTRYINTIGPEQEPDYPGDEKLEKRIRRLVRWNAAVMVTRANQRFDGLGGHMSTYASSASLYEVGFNHFFRGKNGDFVGDAIYIQGHGSPGIYARAYLEGRLGQPHLDHFRRECGGNGLSSYPHPRLMPDFWEYPTVSMGLGPISAIYHARFLRYLEHRGLKPKDDAKVWCFLGDGETDEPEALGAIGLASREGLDNLIFVVNCNLQRLDGPVRGNGKIIQELEGHFRGAGWHVLKVIWGREWDALLAADFDGELVRKMTNTLDGEFQRLSVESGAWIRENFFGSPELRALVANHSDDDLRNLRRGGHDIKKIYAAYAAAVKNENAPTIILAKTVKGWTLGEKFESRNPTHQIKKMTFEELRKFRNRLELPVGDDQLDDPPYYHPGQDSPEVQYLMERRAALGGPLPSRRTTHCSLSLPARSLYEEFYQGTGDTPPVSTTMAFVRLLRKLLKDEKLGDNIVPIIPDEARTFGMEGLFREFKIYAALGQKYEPVDAAMLLSYKESKDGQILEEGINEAGSMASFIASGTSHATTGTPTIPFFIFYSMFGFQRVGDLCWAAADARTRGFMLGATAGRTTLNGEGLQHQDGHSIVLASTNPACVVYDPAFAYEIAVIVEDGLKRMYDDCEDVFYYLTLYNENYQMPEMPSEKGVHEGILRGLYRFRGPLEKRKKAQVRLLGSGSILQQALRAQELLSSFGIASEVWSVTSYVELRRDALEVERQNRVDWKKPEKKPYVTKALGAGLPTVAVSDFMKSVPDMITPWVPGRYVTLGTDGFGRSDTREALRRFFQIDAENIAFAALVALHRDGEIEDAALEEAMSSLGVDPDAVAAVPV
ncbi:MAG: pyruvate dehydrogenase (acetyl-transferring), homodimeric type [Candidatus Eisenbacteria bacterium]